MNKSAGYFALAIAAVLGLGIALTLAPVQSAVTVHSTLTDSQTAIKAGNVVATDGETKIFSDNLELIGNESSVKIYNNVSISYPTGSILRADKVDYDFEKKYFKISMFDDEQIKMKLFK